MKTFRTNSGVSFTIDDVDEALVSRYSWFQKNNGYLFTNPRTKGKPRTSLYLHRLILGAKKGQVVDHADRNPLNNVRSNLRLCSQTMNLGNQGRRRSKPKGVRFNGYSFVASIGFKRKWHYLGSFRSEAEAANAYDEAAKKRFGAFACLNSTA